MIDALVFNKLTQFLYNCVNNMLENIEPNYAYIVQNKWILFFMNY